MESLIMCDDECCGPACDRCAKPCDTYVFFSTHSDCATCAELSTKCIDTPCFFERGSASMAARQIEQRKRLEGSAYYGPER